MKFAVIRKSEIIADAKDRWMKQYACDSLYSRSRAVTLAVAELPEGYSEDDFNRIVGNSSWTCCECDICSNDVDRVVRIQPHTHSDRWLDLCYECASEARVHLDVSVAEDLAQ